MHDYIDKLETVQLSEEQKQKAKQDPTEKIPEELRFAYKSVHAKVRWPVSHVMPIYSYRVSRASQKSREHLTYEDVDMLNDIVDDVKASVSEYGCELKFVRQGLDESNICVLTSFDAGFAKEEHLKSQSGFVTLITSQDITEEAQW